ncbi:Arylsulfatase [Paraglaciecola mesophila]|uniref:Arylsulfatase n=2 Tax=Paraglaciecola mesophila TaxID=197222 RepID=A0A857JK09_9ALTE|nr:Arylsulfatase [Paraglaciecola mesophila]
MRFNRKISTLISVVIVAMSTGVSSCALATEKAAGEQPNILFILADDLGYNDVGFNGSKDISTPNLDALAKQGVTFDAAYVAHPFCGPSRAAIMTGRYPHKIGAQFNLPEDNSNVGVSADETFIAQTMKNAGYFTGAMGKWHLGEAPQYHPNKHGFDEFYGFLGGGHNYFPEEFEKAYNKRVAQGLTNINMYLTPLEHNGKEVRETEYITDGLSREAVTFVDKATAKQQPFFLYLAYNAPHVPLQAKEDDLAQFRHIKDKKRRTYAAMVYAVDRGVGRIVSQLKANGQYENTLIVFMSDNGGKLGQGANNYPLKEGKGSVQEGGFRTPMLMHWPKHIKAGNRFAHPVLALDLYPTFAAIGGASLPEGKILDGKNIWPSLMANVAPHENEFIYVLRHRDGYSDAAARRNQYKAVKNHNQNWKLFNVAQDISEENDISAKHPAILRDMVSSMESWSWNNQQPKWFHRSDEGARWRLKAMPRFDKTFQVDDHGTK